MAQTIDNPEITVLMPVYNGEKYLRLAIESILNQTFSGFEFLIVNDGSTDSSEAIVKSFSDTRIRLIQNTNKGLPNALNFGIHEAKGKYIARMDCDDIALPDRLIRELGVLQKNPEIDIVSSFVSLINPEGTPIKAWQDNGRAITNDEIIKQLPIENCLAHPTIMVKREVLLKYKYNAKQKYAEDWDLWLRMASGKCVFYKINELLLLYRIHLQSAQGLVLNKSHYYKKTKTLFRYFANKLKKININLFDLKVLRSACTSLVRYGIDLISPKLNRTLEQIFAINPFKVISQYSKLKKFCREENGRKDALCLFIPGTYGGKAADFYSELISLCAELNPIVFITSKPGGQFKDNTKVFDISLISDYPGFHRRVKRNILNKISKFQNCTLLGSNSVFYYNLLGSLNYSASCMDLIYLVENPSEAGEEMLKYDFPMLALPYVERLQHRIVVNEKQCGEIKELYENNNVDPKYLERITYFSKLREVIINN